ncbi:MAG TPA: small multi-drug export protein [Bacillota bacterium]
MVSSDSVLKVMITSLLPYLELRAAIPLAWQLGFPAPLALLTAVAGNMLPVIPVMLLIRPVANWLDHIPLFHRFFHWLFTRARSHQAEVKKYGYWALTLFVAVPLPMTGAWSGAVIACILGMRKRYAFFSIFFGVLIAGVIVLLATYGIARLFHQG